MESNQPHWKVTQGGLSATAWLNQRKTPSGEAVEQTAIRIERRYKDADGVWKSTNSYSLHELLMLRHFLGRVIDEALEQRAKDRGERAGDHDDGTSSSSRPGAADDLMDEL